MMNQLKIVEFKIKNDIGILSINNPPQNFLETPDFLNLKELKNWLESNLIKGLIITGGGKHFSAGANLESMYDLALRNNRLKKKLRKGMELLKFIEDISIPTIAAIKGVCFGGGLEIALCCHIKVCSKNSLFAFPEVNHGLMPGLNGIMRLPKLIGTSKSLEMILSGDTVDAIKAIDLNIIDYMVPTSEVFNFSFNLMKKMTSNRSLNVINSVVKALNNSKKLSFKKAMNEEIKLFCKLAIEEAKKNKIK